MKKLFALLITSLILVNLMPLSGSFDAAADEHYSYGCEVGQFEVSYIEDDGSFSKISLSPYL